MDKLKDENTNLLLIEELYLFRREELKLIENRTNLRVLDGMKVLINYLPLVLNKIYGRLEEDIKDKEILILGDDEELTKKVIESIYKNIGFVTISGQYKEEDIENIYEYILDKTGLSIFYSKNIDRILTNYSIIINLIDNYNINFNNVRGEVIIFDFSISKQFSKNIKQNSKLRIVEDFVFKGDNLDIRENDFVPFLIHSYIYEQLSNMKLEDFKGLYVNQEFCTVEDFANYNIKKASI